MADNTVTVRRFAKGGNFFLVAQNGEITLIDTGIRDSVKNIAAKFQHAGFDLKDLKRIVITHSHIDHAGSLAALKRATGALIIAHEEEAPYMSQQKSLPKPNGVLGYPFHWLEPRFRPEPCDVDLLLKDGQTVENTGLTVIHTPGHTPGHICLYHAGIKALFTGDVLVNHYNFFMGPRPVFSTDIEQARRSVRRLTELDLERIYFSHGWTIRNPDPGLIDKLFRSFKESWQ